MYKSPIELITNQLHTQIREETDKKIYLAVQEIGINIDKEELIKALKYDKSRYENGFRDGVLCLASILKRSYTSNTSVTLTESRLDTIIEDVIENGI